MYDLKSQSPNGVKSCSSRVRTCVIMKEKNSFRQKLIRQRLRFQISQHPPYSPDLSPSDYHVLGPLKDALRGRRFGNDDEHSWLTAQLKTFFLME
jgi:hypothetical protein